MLLNSPASCPSLPSVCQEISSFCDFLATQDGKSIDLSMPLFLAVTNILCLICFNTSYKKEHPMLKTMHTFTEGVMDVLSKDNMVDIFPNLKVRMRPGSTFRSQQTLTVPPNLSSY